jgi:hypothetical protein
MGATQGYVPRLLIVKVPTLASEGIEMAKAPCHFRTSHDHLPRNIGDHPAVDETREDGVV